MFVFKTRKFQFKLVGIDVQFFTADVCLYFKFLLNPRDASYFILQDLKKVQID